MLVAATLRGWKSAFLWTAAALALLGAIVAIFGPLLDRMPLHALQLVIGVLLLLFGIGWLRKAALRAGGIIPLHDEDAISAKETAGLAAEVERRQTSQGWIAGIAAFKAVPLEGLEVTFIVIAVGAGRGLLLPASLGALAPCALVLVVGAVAHCPLARVPKNTLKFGVDHDPVLLRSLHRTTPGPVRDKTVMRPR